MRRSLKPPVDERPAQNEQQNAKPYGRHRNCPESDAVRLQAELDAGGVYGDSYDLKVGEGTAPSFAINSGRMAVLNILEKEGKTAK